MGWFFRKKKTKLVEPTVVKTHKTPVVRKQKPVVTDIAFRDDLVKLRKKYDHLSNSYVKELADLLIKADLSSELVLAVTNELQKKISKKTTSSETDELLANLLENKYIKPKKNHLNFKEGETNVALIVGVNGTGKTTTIAKLAHLYKQQGGKIMMVAGDTFRAGAVAQLRYWADLVDVRIVAPVKPNQDPGSVVFEAMNEAIKEQYDLVLIDTAGRLHNKVNLMKQLAKIRNIILKFMPQGIQETLLIIDATTGRNGLQQAEVFHKQIKLTGVIVTKMEGSAKGGNIFTINNKLRLPIRFCGTGEQPTDLVEFNVHEFCHTWIQNETPKE